MSCTYGDISPSDLEYQEKELDLQEQIFLDQLEEQEFQDWLKTCKGGN